MAASAKKKVHVEYNSSDSGSEGDLESTEDISTDEENDGIDSGGNAGLAKVMAKILQKKVPANKVILAKGKTDRELQKRKLAKAEEEEADDKSQPAKLEGKKQKLGDTEDVLPQHEKKKLWENMCRSKPSPLDRDKDRRLQRVATRGVVQLFNAVRKQQKLVEDEIQKVGSTEHKKDRVMQGMTRDKFLDILKGSTSSNVKVGPKEPAKDHNDNDQDNDEAEEEEKKAQWSILREDYMMGAKMKDWDQESSDEGQEGPEQGPGDPELSDSD